jgi:hypothetical protein
MSEPVQVLPLEYAQDETLSWRTAARAVAALLLIYTAARLLAELVHTISFLLLSGVGRFPVILWYALLPPPLIALLIASIYFLHSGKGRIAMVWTLSIYIVFRVGTMIVIVIAGMVSYRSIRASPSAQYVLANYVGQVVSAVADCVWPAAGIWFFTRPALRRVM